jgi:hypothetical protein
MKNESFKIWERTQFDGRGSGRTYALMQQFKEGDVVIVHTGAMADHICRMNPKIQRRNVMVWPDPNRGDLERLKGIRSNVLIDHAALEFWSRKRTWPRLAEDLVSLLEALRRKSPEEVSK